MIEIYITFSFFISIVLFFNRLKTVNYFLIIVFALGQIAFTVLAYSMLNARESVYFRIDAIGLLFFTTLTIVSVPALFHSYIYIATHPESARTRAIYFSAIIALITAIGAAYLSTHIAVTWIFVEITTLSATALIYHHRNERSLEGTWKYLFICAISITFVFIGILFLSLAMVPPGSNELFYDNILQTAANLNPFWLKLAFVFIFTGFTAKIGQVPMYTAGIDAKDKAPTPAGALLSSVLMNMGFIAIFRVYVIISHTSIQYWVNMVIFVSAFLSIFVASVYMIKVKNIKRMLAYSSIEHMGLAMLGLAAGGLGYYAAILHVILHALVKSALFFQFNQVYRIFQSKSIYYVGNYFKYNSVGSMVILLGFFSATAMPPSGLFISEFLIFRALFEAHYFILLIVVLILLTIIIWAFGKNILKLLFTPPVSFDESKLIKINPWMSLTQFILLGLGIYLGLNPPLDFVNLIKEAVKVLPN